MATKSSRKQSALITGCSKGGIGDALAQEFHSRGFRVFATARDLRKIQHLKELGCDVVSLEVLDENSLRKAVEVVQKESGGFLDYLVNNAGISKYPPFCDPLAISDLLIKTTTLMTNRGVRDQS